MVKCANRKLNTKKSRICRSLNDKSINTMFCSTHKSWNLNSERENESSSKSTLIAGYKKHRRKQEKKMKWTLRAQNKLKPKHYFTRISWDYCLYVSVDLDVWQNKNKKKYNFKREREKKNGLIVFVTRFLLNEGGKTIEHSPFIVHCTSFEYEFVLSLVLNFIIYLMLFALNLCYLIRSKNRPSKKSIGRTICSNEDKRMMWKMI